MGPIQIACSGPWLTVDRDESGSASAGVRALGELRGSSIASCTRWSSSTADSGP